jgi:hypothetical protein
MLKAFEKQLRHLRHSADSPVDQIDLTQVLPIFVPAAFFAHDNWPGPYCRLRTPDIGLTWTVLMPHQAMRYVNFEMQQYWSQQRVDWKKLARRNLSELTNARPGVREMRNPKGELSSIAFMFQDGLGPSRLIFREGLAERFPAGYRVAMPEMSCGLAFAKDLHGEEMATIQGLIDHCYRNGSRPFVPETYDSDDLLTVEEVG